MKDLRLAAQDEKALAERRGERKRRPNRAKRKVGTTDSIRVSASEARRTRPYVFGDES